MVTLTNNGIEKTLADWGIVNPRLVETNQVGGAFTFTLDLPMDSADPFGSGIASKIIVKIGRSKSGGVWAGGKTHFVGYRFTEPERSGNPHSEAMHYEFRSVWGWFDLKIFEQTSSAWDNTNHVEFTTERSNVILGQSINGTRQNMQAQIDEVIASVTGQLGDQFGSRYATSELQSLHDFPTYYFPYTAVQNTTCSAVMRQLMKWISANSAWIDYSTAVPTFRVKTRDQLTPVTLPMIGQNEGMTFRRRDDLCPSAIHLIYQVAVTDNGKSRIVPYNDIACAAGYTDSSGAVVGAGQTITTLQAAGRQFGAVKACIPFTGPTSTQTKGVLDTIPYAPADVNFWKALFPELNNVVNLAFAPDTNGNVYTADAALADSSLQYAVVGNTQVLGFMGNPALTQTLTLQAAFSGIARTPDNRDFTIWGSQQKQVQVTVTNVAGGTYFSTPSNNWGETIPMGLAKAIWDTDSVPHYEGTYFLEEEEVTGAVDIGNTLNVSGGMSDWATMNAQIQQITFDYTGGTTTIKVGPPEHLGPQDLVERLRSQQGPRTLFLSGVSRSNSLSNNVIDLTLSGGRNQGSGEPIRSFLAGYQAPDLNTLGASELLGNWWADATNKTLGIAGAGYTSEAVPGDGKVEIKLAHITAPPADTGSPDYGVSGYNPEQRKRDIRLREVRLIDATGKVYYAQIAASAKYSKTANDGFVAGLQLMQIMEVFTDYVLVAPWDGNPAHSVDVTNEMNAAKPFRSRPYTSYSSETFSTSYSDCSAEINLTFTAPPGADSAQNFRAVADTNGLGVTEVQQLIPPWDIGQPVYVAACDHTGVTVSGVELTLVVLEIDRHWGAF